MQKKTVFGISTAGGKIITPNEYWQLHQHTFLDLLAGIFLPVLDTCATDVWHLSLF